MRITIPVSKLSTLVGLNPFESQASYWFDAVVCRMDASMKERARLLRSGTTSTDRIREEEQTRIRASLQADITLTSSAQTLDRDVEDRSQTLKRTAKRRLEAAVASEEAGEVKAAEIALSVIDSAARSVVATTRGTMEEESVRTEDALRDAISHEWYGSPCTVLPPDSENWFFVSSSCSDVTLVGRCDGYVACEQNETRAPLEIKTRVDGKQACRAGPWGNELVQLQVYMARTRAPFAFFVQRTSVRPTHTNGVVVPTQNNRFILLHKIMIDAEYLEEKVWAPLSALVRAARYSLSNASEEEWRDFVTGSDYERARALQQWVEYRPQNRVNES